MLGDNFQTGDLYPDGLTSGMTTTQAASVATSIANGFLSVNTTIVRLPVNPSTVSDPNWWPQYQAAINALIARGLNVDLGYWIENGGGTIYNTTTWNQMWSTINSVYGSNSHVYFEPINEPYGYSASSLATIYENFLTTYNCPNWKCFFDGTGYANNLAGVATDTKLDNQYFAVHIYRDWDGVSQPNDTDPAVYTTALRAAIDGYEKQTVITEMGTNNGDTYNYYLQSGTNLPGWVAYVDGVCNYINANRMGAMIWVGVYDGGGYAWFPSVANLIAGNYSVQNATIVQEQQYGWNVYTSGSVPGIPCNITAVGSTGQITVTWSPGLGTTSNYNVYRGTSPSGESATPIATGLTGTSYTDASVVNGTTYYYTIAAVNSNGASPVSAEASAFSGPAGAVANGTYQLTPACATGSRLDAYGAGTSNGTNVDIYGSNNSGAQKWTFTNTGGWYAVRPSYAGGLALETNGGTGAGTNVDLWSDWGGPNQRWSVSSYSGGYELSPENAPSMALNVTGAGTADGTNVEIWTFSSTDTASLWAIQPTVLANGTYQLTPACASGSCLDANGGGTANGTAVDIWSAWGGSNQKWTFTNTGGGWYVIRPSYSTTLCLEAVGGGISDGTNVDLWSDWGGQNQRWSVTPVSGGYELSPEYAPNLALNAFGNGIANGTNADLWQWTGAAGSVWTIQ